MFFYQNSLRKKHLFLFLLLLFFLPEFPGFFLWRLLFLHALPNQTVFVLLYQQQNKLCRYWHYGLLSGRHAVLACHNPGVVNPTVQIKACHAR